MAHDARPRGAPPPTPRRAPFTRRVVLVALLVGACTERAPTPAPPPGAEPLSTRVARWNIEPALIAEISRTGLIIDGKQVAASPDGSLERALRFDVEASRLAVPTLDDWLADRDEQSHAWGTPAVIGVAPGVPFGLVVAITSRLAAHDSIGFALFVENGRGGAKRSVVITIPCFCRHPYNTLEIGTLSTVGACDAPLIHRLVEAEHYRLEWCASKHATSAPQVELSWLIGADGRVEAVSIGPDSTSHPDPLTECWRQVVASWTVPPISGRACVVQQQLSARRYDGAPGYELELPLVAQLPASLREGTIQPTPPAPAEPPAEPPAQTERIDQPEDLEPMSVRLAVSVDTYTLSAWTPLLMAPFTRPSDPPPANEEDPFSPTLRIDRRNDPIAADLRLYETLVTLRDQHPSLELMAITLEPEMPFTEWLRVAELVATRRPSERADGRFPSSAEFTAARQTLHVTRRGQARPLFPHVRLSP